MRLMKKKGEEYVANCDISTRSKQIGWLRQVGFKLGAFEDLMDKYGFKSVEELDNFIQLHMDHVGKGKAAKL